MHEELIEVLDLQQTRDRLFIQTIVTEATNFRKSRSINTTSVVSLTGTSGVKDFCLLSGLVFVANRLSQKGLFTRVQEKELDKFRTWSKRLIDAAKETQDG